MFLNNVRVVVTGLLVFTCIVNTAAAATTVQRNADGSPVLPDLLNAESAFQIAKDAANVGDFSTAIVALERVLIINPELSNIKYELGLLYKRVGANQRAIYYIGEALKDPAMPSDIRTRAKGEMAALTSTGGRSGGIIYGSLGLRLQHDSNADSISDFKQLNMGALGIDIAPTNPADIKSDASGHLSAAVGYRRYMGAAGASQWNTTLNANLSKYKDLNNKDSSDVGLRSVYTYPVSSSATDNSNVNYSHSVSIGWDMDDDGDMSSTDYGLGFNMSKRVQRYNANFGLSLGLSDDEDIDGSEGNEYQTGASVRFSFSLSENMAASAGFSASGINNKRDVNSYTSAGFNFGLSRRLKELSLSRPAVVELRFSVSEKSYHEPNLAIDPTQRRVDQSSTVSATIKVPLAKKLELRTGLSHTHNGSNLVNFEYDNTSATLGLFWTF